MTARDPDSGRYVWPGFLGDVFWDAWPGDGDAPWTSVNSRLEAMCHLDADWPEGQPWPNVVAFAFRPSDVDWDYGDVAWLIETLAEQWAPIDRWTDSPAREDIPERSPVVRSLAIRLADLPDDTATTLKRTRRMHEHDWLPE